MNTTQHGMPHATDSSALRVLGSTFKSVKSPMEFSISEVLSKSSHAGKPRRKTKSKNGTWNGNGREVMGSELKVQAKVHDET